MGVKWETTLIESIERVNDRNKKPVDVPMGCGWSALKILFAANAAHGIYV